MKKETSNKILLGLVSFIFLTSILSYAVFAAEVVDQASFAETGKSIGAALKGFGLIFGGIMEGVFGGEWAYGTRILFFILLWLIIWNILPAIIGDHPWIVGWASAIIAAISIISIPTTFLDAITLQYGAMGAALLSVLPFLIILAATVKMKNALGARVLWIFYAFYYFGLLIYRIYQIANTNGAPLQSGEALAYIIAILAGIIMAVAFVGKIRRLFFLGEIDAIEEEGAKHARRKKADVRMTKADVEAHLPDSTPFG